ncbi:MAG: hypothetical protein Q9163_006177 [Psora crenata]
MVGRSSKTSTLRPKTTRRTALHQRKVGEPTDFRRICSSPVPGMSTFRPIQLSIYVPGNELPRLPRFSDDPDDDDDMLPVPGPRRPAHTMMRSTSDTFLPRLPSSFSIPRKPLASSQSSSIDTSRQSLDSDVTLVDGNWRPLRSSSFYSRQPRPSVASTATSRSNQEFLAMLNPPLHGHSPSQSARAGAGTPDNNTSSIYRRASEQSHRLQTHLKERDIADARSPDCSTIAEVKSPGSAAFATTPPIPSTQQTSSTPRPAPEAAPSYGCIGVAVTSEAVPADSLTKPTRFPRHQSRFPINPTMSTAIGCASIRNHASQSLYFDEPPPSYSSGGAPVVDSLSASSTPDFKCTDPFEAISVPDAICHTHHGREGHPVGQRLSQWFARAQSPPKERLLSTPDLLVPEEQERSESTASDRSRCVGGGSIGLQHTKSMDDGKTVTVSKKARRGPRKSTETFSTCVTERDPNVEVAKFPIPEDMTVGVAM